MKKTLILTAALVCAAFAVNAATLVDNWSGSSWNAANQPDFVAGSGILYSLPSSTAGTSLHVEGAYAGSLQGGNAGDYFYTLFTKPLFTFSNDAGWEGVTQVKLEILYGGMAFDNNGMLSFEGQPAYMADSFSRVAAEGVENDFSDEAFLNTYIWDFQVPVDLKDFVLDFSTTANHVAIFDITLSVETSAVPEPSTYALIAGGLGLATVVAIRRRRRA